jgi:Cellulase (glycosyl hydrolase family 5)
VTRPLVLLLAALALLAAGPAAASASSTQESTFQDDNHLVYSSPDKVRGVLDELAGLGVDRLRITMLWEAVAPQPGSRTKPAFDASDPAAYPPNAWDRYETVLREARARGMDVSFDLTAPAPLWATGTPPREDIAKTFEPSPVEFGRFVTAAGRRFPTVHHWSIWNEPNQSGWLTPQFADAGGGRFVEAAPRIYRALADAGYAALLATGHQDDVILMGETAPKGDASRGVKRRMKALQFVRGLYCVDAKLRPLTGQAAADQACEPGAAFAKAHPVLFRATGYAHHPYELLLAPTAKQADPDFVTLSSLGRLTKTLDGAFRARGVARRVPLYLTEYGYQTNPPDDFGVSWAQQAAYLDESEYLTFHAPRVRTLAQFLLFDDVAPIGLTFQSGLRTADGRPKPSLAAYRLPVYVKAPTVRRGRAVSVWGLLRAKPAGQAAVAQVQLRTSGSARWRTARSVRVVSRRGSFTARVRLTRSARVRIVSGDAVSREVRVRVR